MDEKLFGEMMTKGRRPSQNYSEWRMFIILCALHMKERGVKNPMVVEIGTWKNRQKQFYKEFLNAEHISIDITNRRGKPTITGDSHDLRTMAKLKERLNGRKLNILFIDGGHTYDDARLDWEMYSPLCTDIIAFHDIQCHRHSKDRQNIQAWKFWDDLKKTAYSGTRRRYKGFLFIDLFRYRGAGNGVQMGIGMAIRQ